MYHPTCWYDRSWCPYYSFSIWQPLQTGICHPTIFQPVVIFITAFSTTRSTAYVDVAVHFKYDVQPNAILHSLILFLLRYLKLFPHHVQHMICDTIGMIRLPITTGIRCDLSGKTINRLRCLSPGLSVCHRPYHHVEWQTALHSIILTLSNLRVSIF